ncbi:MAG: DUF5915 domain-containing protein, partial [Patescibacteria group bacterium]|nr:DUF5915 domain-containing protein [Patescibacteria group bacterium]
MDIVKEELNVKNITESDILADDNAKNIGEVNGIAIELNIEISDELKQEGQAREIIRHIQQMRKGADYQVDDRIVVWYEGMNSVFEEFDDMISKEVLADEVKQKQEDEIECDSDEVFTIGEEEIHIYMKK